MDPGAIPADAALMHFATVGGAGLFDSHCVGCHGKGGHGDPARGVPNLSDHDWLYGTGSISDIEQTIAYGIRSRNPKAWNLAIMPAFATPHSSPKNPTIPPLSPLEIHDVVEFLFLKQRRPADQTSAARGAAIYGDRGGCFDCHEADAKGDPAIGAPNLTDNITLYSDGNREALFISIAYGRQGVCPGWIRQLAPLGIRELAVYVYSLSHPGSTE
jgi:cytochrome c oxidase cbb3-type subunit 3